MITGYNTGDFRQGMASWWHPRVALLLAAFLIVSSLTCIYPQASLAQPVTYTRFDYSPGATGTYSFSSGSPPSYTIQGAGAGFQPYQDQLTYVCTEAAGNIELECEVFSQQNTNSNAQAGLQFRANTYDQNAPMCAIAVTPGNNLNFYYRDRQTFSTTVTGPAVVAPCYLRLVRSGNTISGYYSTTGLGGWTLVGSHTPASGTIMPPLYYSGFYVSSGVSGTLSQSVFKYVSYMTSVPQTSSALLQWLRADAGITLGVGTGVSTWSDMSGNSNDATQATGALQPQLSTGVINSAVLPTVTFDGSSQYMTIASDFSDLTTGGTIIAVVDPTSGSATGTPCAYGNASNSDAIFPQTVGTQAKLNAYNSSTSSSVTTTDNPLTTSTYQVLEETFAPGGSSGTGTIYVNGTQHAQSTSLVSTLTNTTRSSSTLGVGIGLSNYFQGGIAELLVFNKPLSDSERHSVESYVFSKYNVGNEPTLDAPTFSPGAGVFLPGQTITPAQSQNGVIYYTVDGSTPSPSSSLIYNGTTPVYLDQTRTIKFIAAEPFFNNSSVSSALFQIGGDTNAVPRSGLVLWLDASSGVTASSGNVSLWSDLSASGNDASQSNSSNKPTAVSNAINSLQAVGFNGSSQFLQLPAGLANFASGASVFVVAKPTAVTSGARFLDFGNGATANNLLLDEPSTNGVALYVYNGSSPTNVTSSSGVTVNQFQLLEALHNGTASATVSTNGVQGAQNTSMNSITNTSRADNYIGQGSGGGNYFQGQIAEILVWNRALSTSEEATVTGYLLNKYQLLPSVSVAAPTISVAAGTLSAPTPVAIEAPANAEVRFTTDGTTPTTSSNLYSGPIKVSYTQTVKAIAVVNGVSSSVASAAYTLDSTLYPAPSGSDTTPLQIQIQLPVNGIPQDSSQH